MVSVASDINYKRAECSISLEIAKAPVSFIDCCFWTFSSPHCISAYACLSLCMFVSDSRRNGCLDRGNDNSAPNSIISH